MITPLTIKKEFAGKKFSVQNQLSDTPVEFSFPSTFTGWPRRGSEGLVVPVTCHHPKIGDVPSILKIFDHHVPERDERQRYLLEFGLASLHEWIYEGVPYSWIDKTIEGHRVYGHVAKHVCWKHSGDDFRIVRGKQEYDDVSDTARKEYAGQLCTAILGLEKLGIAHGDLSPANIVLAKTSEGKSQCVLVDYDGFYSEAVPPLPFKYNQNEIRLYGAPGYQHPSLMQELERSAKGEIDNIQITSDRFALAVLCFELVTWRYSYAERLPYLLDLDSLKAGITLVPDEAMNIWPEGYRLLERAAVATSSDSCPSPSEWLSVLGFLTGHENIPVNWGTPPRVKIYSQIGNRTPQYIQTVEFSMESGSTGTLSPVDANLSFAHYGYERNNNYFTDVYLEFEKHQTAILQRDGKTSLLERDSGKIYLKPSDIVLANNFRFEVE